MPADSGAIAAGLPAREAQRSETQAFEPRGLLSIGTRLALRYSIATTALIGLLTFHLYRQIESYILGGAETELLRHAAAVAEAIARFPDDPRTLGAFLEMQIAGTRTDLRIAIDVWNDAGERIVSRDVLSPFDGPPPAWTPQQVGDHWIYPIERGAGHPTFALLARNEIGTTRVSLHGESFLESAAAIRNTFLLSIPLAILATGIAGSWLARQSLRPISEIAATARRISASPSSESIPVRGSGDELDLLAATLNEMLDRVRSGMERIRQFSADAAHELRTPLSVVRTRIEVTLEMERSPEEYRRVLEECLGDLTLLAEGVLSVLRLASSEAGLAPGSLERVDLAELVASVVEFFEPIAEEREIEIRYQRPPPCEIAGERVWLARLFSNLVDNALKYSDPGSSVRLEIQAGSDHFAVSIADAGVGIPSEAQARIFERFYRGETPRGAGLGIGLPLAQEIARAHGGTIEVESRLGRGSRFRVCLPRDAGAAPSAA